MSCSTSPTLRGDEAIVSQPDTPNPSPGSRPVEWGPGKTPRGRARLPSSRSRAKPMLSCQLCRQMKLRCDRKHPCFNCAKRELGQSCTYSPNTAAQTSEGAERRPVTVKDRIQQLEGLVINLAQAQKASASESARGPREPQPTSQSQSRHCSATVNLGEDNHEPASQVSDCGSRHVTQSGPSYVNSSHWAAVLDDVADLQDCFEKEEQMKTSNQHPHIPFFRQNGPQLLYGCPRFTTKEEILASMPSRQEVDRLVSSYFNAFEISPAVLHSVQFLKEYEAFWQNPSETPVIWLGQLFSIMCLATFLQKSKLDPTVQGSETLLMVQELEKSIEEFRETIAQCLVLGNYVKGGPFVLETLLLYFMAELFLGIDADIGIWILLGIIMQVAMQMGYHRDPKHFKGITPFAAEMQKRIWATIAELDFVIASQMGLPRMLKQWQADTTEFSNLHDWEFDKTTVSMPLSRPETESTPMLFRLAKFRMVMDVGSIWDFVTDTRSHSYTEVMALDSKLQKAHRSIPESFKWRSISECITDTHQAVLQKASLEILFHRAKIVLHRKYMRFSSTNTHYNYSTQTCLSAALSLLDFQDAFQGKADFFGQLSSEKWRLSSLIKNNFLLATSILCLYLQKLQSQTAQDTEDTRAEEIRAALMKSYNIWLQSSSSSKEANKVVKALRLVLGIDSPSGPSSSSGTPVSGFTGSPSTANNGANYRQEHQTNFSFGAQFQPCESASWPYRTTQLETEFIATFPGFFPGTGNVEQQLMDSVGNVDFQQWSWPC